MRPKKYFYTITEASQFLGLSSNTLRNWETQGKLIPTRTKGGNRRYRFEQLKVLLKLENPALLERRMTRGSQIAQKARRSVNQHIRQSDNLKFRTLTTQTTRFLFIASCAALIIFSAGALVTTRYLNSFDTFDTFNTSDTSGTASVLGETATPTPTPETKTEEKEVSNSFTVQTARDENITLVPSGGAGQVIIRSSTTSKDSLYVQNANLTTGSLISGYVGNNGTNYNLLYLSSGSTPVERFSVDALGNVYAAGPVSTNQLNISGVTRFNPLGRLASITGYYQDSGLFEIDQGSPDTATIEKTPTAAQGPSTADVFKITLDETNTTASNTDAFVIERKNAGSSGYAFDVRSGNTNLAGDLIIGGNTTITGNITSSSGSLSVSTLTVTGSTDLQGSVADSTGNLTFADAIDVSGATTLSSTLAVSGASTLSSTLNVTGITTLSANLNANGGLDVDDAFVVADGGVLTTSQTATFNSTLTANGALNANLTFTLGDSGDTGSISTSDWAVTTTGVLTGISGITTDGAYTQSGTGANTLTGATSFTAAGTALSVTNTASIGVLSVSGTSTLSGDITFNATTPNIAINNAETLTITDGTTTLFTLADGGTTGNGTFTGNLTVNGNTTLGDTAADIITITGVVASSIVADSNTRNIGSSGTRWGTGYFDSVNATSLTGTVVTGSTTSSSWTINSDNTSANAEIATLAFETGTNPINSVIQWNASGDTSNKVSGYDDYILANYPIALYSQVSGANQTFTSGSLFKYGQNATHAITQSAAFTGVDLDFSSNITVPNTSSGNQTGSKVTLKDGGASATSIGYQTAGTLDYGIDLGGTIGTAEIRLSNGETISNLVDGTLALTATTVTTSAGLTVGNALTVTTGGAAITGNSTITGTLSSLTGLTSSGTITFSGLTADRGVFTTTGGALTTTAASLALINSISDETGSGSLVFGTSPTLTTSLLTDSTTFALLNTTATTVNFAGAATTISVGAGTGTTTVNHALSVTGQCVAAGTRIRRRRRRRRKRQTMDDGDKDKNLSSILYPQNTTINPLSSTVNDYIYEDVPVEDIAPGDEVLSLNDQTGEFEWHKVEETMDKGIQQTFKLVTQKGKWIETTAEHPYLIIEKQTKIDRKPQRLTTFEVDQSMRIENKTADTILGLANIESSFITKLDKRQKQVIYKEFSRKGRSKSFGHEIFARMIIATIIKSELSVTDLVIDDEYPKHEMEITSIIRTAFPNMGVYFKSIGRHSPAHLAAYLAHTKRNIKGIKKAETMANSILKGFLASELLHPEFTGIRSPHGLLLDKNYTTKWEKVKHLRPGMTIATISGWEKIQAKYPTGRKQTYDLQIEGTKNFVGNEIVAHNTYINSAATSGVSLDVDTNSLTTGTGLDISSTATSFNGELLTLSKTGASGSTAFTSDIANITYSQTFNAAPGDSTGNALDISRAITIDDGTAGAITGTVSGALVALSDNCAIGTADTCTHTANVLSLTQSYASSSGAVLALSNSGSGADILGTSSTWSISKAGAAVFVGVNSGSGLIQGTGGLTVTGTTNINATGTSTTNIGNSTGALTLASGGTSSWTNTSGNLTIQTATSGTMAVDSAGALNLGTTNSTATSLGKAATTLTINPTAWTATPTISGAVTMTSGFDSNAASTVAGLTVDANGNLTVSNGTLSVTAPSTTGNAGAIIANSLTTGAGLDISSTSTAGGVSGISKLLNLSRSGANAQLAHTAYGIYSAVTNTNATSGTNIAGYFSASGATTANYGLIVESGNVGIGTTGPGAKLHVESSGPINILARTTSSTSYSSLRLYNDQNSNVRALEIDYSGSAYASSIVTNGPTGESAAITTTGAYPLTLNTNNTFRMIVDSGGNVGIGTASPLAKTAIAKGTPPTTVNASDAYLLLGNSDTTVNSYRMIGFGYTDAATYTTIPAYIGYIETTATGGTKGPLVFATRDVTTNTAPTERMRIDPAGTLLVNSTSLVSTSGQDFRIQVQDTGLASSDADGGTLALFSTTAATSGADVGSGLTFGGYYTGTSTAAWSRIRGPKTNSTDINYSGYLAFDTRTSGGNLTEKMRIDNTGNVGIGTTGPGATLDVASVAHLLSENSSGLLRLKSSSTQGGRVRIQQTLGSDTSGDWAFHFDPNLARVTGLDTAQASLWINNGSWTNVFAIDDDQAYFTGNVGIGTTSPDSPLTVYSATSTGQISSHLATATGAHLLFTDVGNVDMSLGVLDGQSGLSFHTGRNPASAGTELMRLTSGGNVGIGTTSPVLLSAGKEVTITGSSARGTLNLQSTSTGTTGTAGTITAYNGSTRLGRFDISADGATNSGYMALYTTSAGTETERIRITSGGNVGIGTTGPSKLLHVLGTQTAGYNTTEQVLKIDANTNSQASIANGFGVGIDFHASRGSSDNAARTGWISSYLVGGAQTTEDTWGMNFGIRDNDTERTALTILNTGNVGIGTVSPGAKLEISGYGSGSIDRTQGIRLADSSTGDGAGMTVWNFNPGGSDSYRNLSFYATGWDGAQVVTRDIMTIGNYSGYVGIGDTDPDALLDVKGTVCLDLNADEACTDNTAAISDARLKTNVTDIENGLQLVGQLHPVRFTWNGQYNTGTSNSLGFLAQEVETIFPELVITDTAGYKNLDYSKLTAVLVKSIQELNQKVTTNLTTGIIKTSELWVEGVAVITDAVVTGSLEVKETLTAKTVKTDKLLSPLVIADQIETKSLTTQTAQIVEATVSGTLYADVIKARRIETDEIQANESIVERIRSRLESLETTIAESYNEGVEERVENLLAQNQLESAVAPLTDTSSYTEDPSSGLEVNAATINVTGNLSVLGDISAYGTTRLADTFIKGKLAVSSITAPEGVLNILDGLLIVDSSTGNVTVSGNLTVTEKITASEGGFGKLLAGEIVTKEVTTEKLIIASAVASESATVAGGEVTTNATAGKATLKAGETSLKIYNSEVTDNTLIYVTPNSSTGNQVLYVASKESCSSSEIHFAPEPCAPYFTVAIDSPLDTDVEFNWWIIELRE